MKARAKAGPARLAPVGHASQHYTAFTVEFLLSARKRVRRTKVTFVPTGGSETWPGWDAERLLASFVRHADLRLPAPPPAIPIPASPAASPETPPAVEPAPQPGRLQLQGLTLLSGDVAGSQVSAGAEYELRVNLTARDFKDSPATAVTYLLVVFARELGSGVRYVVAATCGRLAEGAGEIQTPGRALSPGLYRLEAFAIPVGRGVSSEPWLEGRLIQVW